MIKWLLRKAGIEVLHQKLYHYEMPFGTEALEDLLKLKRMAERDTGKPVTMIRINPLDKIQIEIDVWNHASLLRRRHPELMAEIKVGSAKDMLDEYFISFDKADFVTDASKERGEIDLII